jgi:serine protease Do
MGLEGFRQIAERLRRSTVQITSGRRGQGSGFIVKSDGTIVTNAHVVGDSCLEVRLWDGSSFPACLEQRSTRRDLAVLRVAATNFPAVTLAKSDELRVGELVIAVGNPFGFMGAVTTGIVHAIGRCPELGPTKWVQADAQLAPGNSGGPLADTCGSVVGVNTLVVAGLGLALPSSAVARLLARDVERPGLGVVFQPVSVRVSGTIRLGLKILELVHGGAAEYVSLRAGDTLIAIEGQALGSLDDLEQALEGGGERLLRLQFIRGEPDKIRNVVLRLRVFQAAMP